MMLKSMDKDIFKFSSYKAYLRLRTGGVGRKTGSKSALARALSCQATYISQVLHGHAHLSLEQAEMANGFFTHTKDESTYFLLLVQKERAGTVSLARFFQEQMDEIHNRRLVLTSRLGVKQMLNPEDQSIYYSSWIYAAVHIALTIPELRTRESLAEYLSLSVAKVTEVLEFLVSASLAVESEGSYQTGNSQIRLGKNSHNILKHHSNWRVQAIESLEREGLSDLHYSGVVSISTQDVMRIKNRILDMIGEIQETVRESKSQELCGIAMDLFKLQRN